LKTPSKNRLPVDCIDSLIILAKERS